MSDTLYWSTAGEEQTRLCGPVNGAPRGRRGGESRLESDCGAQHRKHRTTKTERGKASQSAQTRCLVFRFQSPQNFSLQPTRLDHLHGEAEQPKRPNSITGA